MSSKKSNKTEFEALAELLNAGVIIHDSEGKIVYLNEFARNFLNIEEKASTEKQYSLEHWNFLAENGQAMEEEQFPFSVAMKLKRKAQNILVGFEFVGSKSVCWALCNATPVFDDQENIIQVMVAFTDETESHVINRQLDDERARLSMAESLANIGSWDYNLQTKEIFWSDQVYKIFDLDPRKGPPSFEEYLSLFSQQDQAELLQCIEQAISKGKPYQVNQELIDSEGKVRYIKGFGKVVSDKNNTLSKLHGAVMDVTELTEAEQEVKTLAQIAKTSDNVVVVTNAVGEIEWVNQGFVTLTGYELHEVTGKKPGSFLQGPDTDPATVELLRQAIKDCKPLRTEILNYSKDGKPYWLNINLQPIFDKYKNISKFVAIELDLTERRKAEEEIKSLAERLGKALDDKNRFFSLVAHDLRAPLSALIDLMNVLTEEIDLLSKADIQELSKGLLRDTKNTLNLVDNLLSWARSLSGVLKTNPSWNTLLDAVNSSKGLLDQVAKAKNIKIEIEANNSIPKTFCDSNMIETVIRNLLSNAIKFSKQGSSIYIRLNYDQSSDSVWVDVQDAGIGMSQEVQDNLLGEHHSNQSAGTAGEKGTGLGLILCKDFVELHGGVLKFDSAPGKGTTFTFNIPVNNHPEKKVEVAA